MTTPRIAAFIALSLAAVGCGPQQSSDFGSTSALKAPKGSKVPTAPTSTSKPAALSGAYTVANTPSCGGQFNLDDPSAIIATATTVTITQNGYSSEPDVFFTATIGDIITPPDPAFVADGAQVSRTIAAYGDDGSTFTFKQYYYDASLTDAEGLATGLFQTVTLDAVSTGVSYDTTFSDGEDYRCSFVTAS